MEYLTPTPKRQNHRLPPPLPSLPGVLGISAVRGMRGAVRGGLQEGHAEADGG